MNQRIALKLAYHGGNFQGWQIQAQEAPADSHFPNRRTVQGVLEAALEKLVGRPVRVHGSGRTDTGVHAEGQVAHFDVSAERAHLPWQNALNALLPDDVAVLDARPAPPDFHARFSAVSKTYRYLFWLTPGYVLPQRKPFVWNVARQPDQNAFNRAALAEALAALPGRHDFAAFQNVGTPVSSTKRTILDARLEDHSPHELALTLTADGFLKQMVRNLAGCLAMIGQNRLPPSTLENLLAARDRRLAPATAPARGLTLVRAEYGEGAPFL